MEVLLQYWDELDDTFHSLRFQLRRARLRWLAIGSVLILLGSCASVV
ncbi:MAG: hypothetical protein AAFZ58_14685 [Pseudomonadota bacterium]